MSTAGRAPYVPPTGDEPLDAIELAIVRALVPILVAQIRAARTAERPDQPAESPIAAGGESDAP